MARTVSISDEDLLNAAKAVFYERGVDAFTISEVAARVGLSRAAIILRFKSTQDLKITLMQDLVQNFIQEVEQLPSTASTESLLHIAAYIGYRVHNRHGLGMFLHNHFDNLDEPELAELEQLRGKVWHEAIAKAMPPLKIGQDAAVNAFSAHMSGTLLAWAGNTSESCLSFMMTRTQQWLTMVGQPVPQACIDRIIIDSAEPTSSC